MSGLFGLGGSGLSSAMSVKIAREQMNFQERMSNSAYQRTMADMKAAGLNPMLVAKLGGASTPPGASAPVNLDANSAMKSGQDAATSKETRENLRTQRDNITADSDAKRQSTAVGVAQAKKIEAETRLLQKGGIRADVEGKAAGVIDKIGTSAIKETTDAWNSSKQLMNKVKDGSAWQDLKNRVKQNIRNIPSEMKQMFEEIF